MKNMYLGMIIVLAVLVSTTAYFMYDIYDALSSLCEGIRLIFE